jgi:hypothetical protein
MRQASPFSFKTNDYARSRQAKVRNFAGDFRALSGTDDRRSRRMEMPVGVHDRLGTKAAHAKDKDDVPERFHLLASTQPADVAVVVPAGERPTGTSSPR